MEYLRVIIPPNFHFLSSGTQRETLCYLLRLNNYIPGILQKGSIRKSACKSFIINALVFVEYKVCLTALRSEEEKIAFEWDSPSASIWSVWWRCAVISPTTFVWIRADTVIVRPCEADRSSVNTSSVMTLEINMQAELWWIHRKKYSVRVHFCSSSFFLVAQLFADAGDKTL